MLVPSLQRDDTSVLDVVMEDPKALRRRGSVRDNIKIDEYLESVRSVERRIETALRPQKRWINEGRFDVARPAPGIPKSHEEHVRLMLDILLLAFWTDSTRIATFMFGDAQTSRNFSFVDGVKGGFHELSHHRDEIAVRDQYERIGTWHVKQFAWFLERMQSLDEGGTSLLDNSMVLFGSDLKDGNLHNPQHPPVVLPLLRQGAGALGGACHTASIRRCAICTFRCSIEWESRRTGWRQHRAARRFVVIPVPFRLGLM